MSEFSIIDKVLNMYHTIIARGDSTKIQDRTLWKNNYSFPLFLLKTLS